MIHFLCLLCLGCIPVRGVVVDVQSLLRLRGLWCFCWALNSFVANQRFWFGRVFDHFYGWFLDHGVLGEWCSVGVAIRVSEGLILNVAVGEVIGLEAWVEGWVWRDHRWLVAADVAHVWFFWELERLTHRMVWDWRRNWYFIWCEIMGLVHRIWVCRINNILKVINIRWWYNIRRQHSDSLRSQLIPQILIYLPYMLYLLLFVFKPSLHIHFVFVDLHHLCSIVFLNAFKVKF